LKWRSCIFAQSTAFNTAAAPSILNFQKIGLSADASPHHRSEFLKPTFWVRIQIIAVESGEPRLAGINSRVRESRDHGGVPQQVSETTLCHRRRKIAHPPPVDPRIVSSLFRLLLGMEARWPAAARERDE
jgi:hypothetical protein